MKAHLMFRDRDFDLRQELPPNEQALRQDLELGTLLGAMALGDQFTYEVAEKAVMCSLNQPETIVYRQDILKDCIKNPAIVREIYDLALETITSEKKNFWGIFRDYPAAILRRSIGVLQMFAGSLRTLRRMADEDAHLFESEGFRTFFAMLSNELSDEYLATVQDHLERLRFRDGVLISAELGPGNQGTNYVLRKPHARQSWVKQVLTRQPRSFTFRIAERDESGARALSELTDRGINLVANALAQSNDHILSFFSMLRTELAFYIGCLNLHEQVSQLGAPVTFPVPVPSGDRRCSMAGVYDVCLALTMKRQIVGNDVNADAKDLVMITGANQGGKSTFLRSVGLAQLMMQCGMFVPAETFEASICDGLFTHYKREEDNTMKSGKLDEELSRMSDIVDNLRSGSMVLFNESFAATNEREGSEIARQIVDALLDKGIRVFMVTHLFELAHRFHERGLENAMFLRAEREIDGRRTFKLFPGEPLGTSYGKDLYLEIFGSGSAVHSSGG